MNILLISGYWTNKEAVSGDYLEANTTIEIIKKLERLLTGYANVTVYPLERNATMDLCTGDWQVGWSFDYVLELQFNVGGGTGSQIYVTSEQKKTKLEEKMLQYLELFFHNGGVMKNDLFVIKTANEHGIPSALLQPCYIDNPLDMAIYEKAKDRISTLITVAIVQEFHLDSTIDKFYKVPRCKGLGLIQALQSIDVDSSYCNRRMIAQKNGIKQYRGDAMQDKILLFLLYHGKLKK